MTIFEYSAEMGRMISEAPERTVAFGRALGALLAAGDVVGLVGDLGAGKTCLTQGIARGLGVDPAYRVASPTFTLINEYPARVPLFHIDLYRLADADEMVEVGVIDALGGPQVCVVEWFDRLESEGLVPVEHMFVRFEATGDATRTLTLHARGARHRQLAQTWLRAGRPGLDIVT